MRAELKKIRFFLGGIFLLLVSSTIYFAKDVILPVVLGLLLALTVSPVVRAGRRAGIAPPITAVVVVGSLAVAGGIASYMLGGVVGDWIDEAPELSQQLREKLDGVIKSVEEVKDASDEVEKMASAESEEVEQVVVKQPGLLSSTIGSLASFGTSMLVGLVLALLLLSSGDLFYVKLIDAYSRLEEKKRALQIVYDIERGVSRYLLSITLINAGLGVAVAVALFILGVPYPLVWGTFAFALNYLPFLGAIVGAALIAGYSIITFDSLSYALLVPAVYLSLTSLEGQIVTPYLLGRSMEMNTVSVFLSVIAWTWLWGVAGALTAVPILVVIKTVCDHVDSWSTLGNFLGSRDAKNARRSAQQHAK